MEITNTIEVLKRLQTALEEDICNERFNDTPTTDNAANDLDSFYRIDVLNGLIVEFQSQRYIYEANKITDEQYVEWMKDFYCCCQKAGVNVEESKVVIESLA